jgi:integrase
MCPDVVTAREKGMEINGLLRNYLRTALEIDREQRISARPFRPLFTPEPFAGRTSQETDVEVLDGLLSDRVEALFNRDKRRVWPTVEAIAAAHNVPPEKHDELAIGVLEMDVHLFKALRDRSTGTAPLVFSGHDLATVATAAPPYEGPEAQEVDNPGELPAAAPPSMTRDGEEKGEVRASKLVAGFFDRRRKIDNATNQVINQERGTLTRFIEAAGDRPLHQYRRSDITAFIGILRQLPSTYGKSHRDKEVSLDDLIARADAEGPPRMKDKTVKRHVSTLSQFFRFGVDEGLLTQTARTDLVGSHRFQTRTAANKQRNAWTMDELRTLFGSEIWKDRIEVGQRTARFWLPILALYHGSRLEEFADLRRCDIQQRDGIWVAVFSEEARRLKNANATRIVPIHPEVLRLGFLEYSKIIAPLVSDPLFPDLPPQGPDNKRGPRITRWFVEYRKKIGIYRHGVGMHAFRHVAITRLNDTITTEQQRRDRDAIMGHAARGGEGESRYDKGPAIASRLETLTLLQFPEIDLTRHYTPTT